MEPEWERLPAMLPAQRFPHGPRRRPSTADNATQLQPLHGPFSSTSAVAQRRRLAAAQSPPPPPNEPIPNLPDFENPSANSSRVSLNTSSRSYGSANLAAVAAFSEARQNSFMVEVPSPPRLEPDHRDEVPLAPSSPPPTRIMHDQVTSPDRSLLSPPLTTATPEPRHSSRRALTRALELAREAVKLDANNDDPHGAVLAYGRSVALLGEVMERVRRGEDGAESGRRRSRRRRSVIAQEEEVRRLKTIHDTYADRMNILSLIYSIPPIPYSPTSVYPSPPTTTSNGPQPQSPESHSPSDAEYGQDSLPSVPDYPLGAGDQLSATDAQHDDNTGVTSPLDRSTPSPISGPFSTLSSSGTPSSFHPYASHPPLNEALAEPFDPSPLIPFLNRNSPIPPASIPTSRRPRASSNLPPLAPPPHHSPPPAPRIEEIATESTSSSVVFPSGNLIGREKIASDSRLEALEEEGERKGHFATHIPRRRDQEADIREPDHRTAVSESTRFWKRDEPLPPLPSPSSSLSSAHSPKIVHALATTENGGSNEISSNGIDPWSGARISLPTSSSTQQQLINDSTVMGTIHQRRSKNPILPNRTSSPPETASPNVPRPTPTPPLNTQDVGRARAFSQPGRKPSLSLSGNRAETPDVVRPPIPVSGLNGNSGPGKSSGSSKLNPSTQQPQLVIQTESLPPVAPPLTTAPVQPALYPNNLPTTPTSPLPTAPPTDALRKPYHLMSLLHNTMTSKTGGYLTRRLHVPQEVWSQGGAKLTSLVEKVRVVEVLCSALEELEASSKEIFGTTIANNGALIGVASIGRKEADTWISKLDELSSVCDGVVASFGKKLGVGEGFVSKKISGVTSWGGKLSRQLDKFTNGKNLDSPATYVLGLGKLFSYASVLDEHTRALLSQPIAPVYASLPPDARATVEMKLKRSSEFFATVVLTFVVRDLSLLLDKYAKKCEKWLAE